ncbi:hypothetical protein JOE38_001038 [Clavibacter michiganensis]|uniref:hypothetical protein n=1 Tax=Clavibacter michiganensis TaxID=28447 RepID=UPI0019568BE6|nr:hypothetical protein [Clavibacter michiganensis]MBM7411215.1 hypothetical protein [Clavibacter michiganensis]
MDLSARSRRSPALALALALVVGASLLGATPARSTPAPVFLAAPEVVVGGEVTDVPEIEVYVGLDVGHLELVDPRFEYLLDGRAPWKTAHTGPLDSAIIRLPAPAGPHTISLRAVAVVDGTRVVGAASAPLAVTSRGYPTPYAPVVDVEGPRITVSWDVRAALAGWPEDGSVHVSFDSGPDTVGGAVGSITVEPGHDRTLSMMFWFGGNVDIARYVYREVSSGSAPGALPLTSTPLPAIVGHAAIGTTLSVRTGTWRPAPVSLAYRWERDGVPISDERGPTYEVTGEDAGRRITVAVRGSSPGRIAVERTSAATPRVGAWAIVPGTPVVGGVPAVGRELTARPGSWRPAPVTFSYRWLRDGAEIPGATSARYTATPEDRGHLVSVRVIGTKDAYPYAERDSAGRRIG